MRAAADRQRAVEFVAGWLGAQPGWRLAADVSASPIRGGSGNQEFLIGAVHGG